MAEEKKTPPQTEPKKRTRRKPLSLHPMTEDEALRRILRAGPDPEKQGKKSAKKSAKKDEH